MDVSMFMSRQQKLTELHEKSARGSNFSRFLSETDKSNKNKIQEVTPLDLCTNLYVDVYSKTQKKI